MEVSGEYLIGFGDGYFDADPFTGRRDSGCCEIMSCKPRIHFRDRLIGWFDESFNLPIEEES